VQPAVTCTAETPNPPASHQRAAEAAGMAALAEAAGFETPAISSVQGTKRASPEGLLEAPNSRLRVNTPALTPGAIGGATAPASAVEASTDLGTELRALKKLFEEGLMTESEYEHARLLMKVRYSPYKWRISNP